MVQQPQTNVARKFGIELVGAVPWGTHLCQFYESKQDLINILVPYFSEGLRSNEFCMWVTSPPLEVEEATKALKESVPDLEEYVKKGQIEIISYNDWYLVGGKFDSNRVLQGWVEKEKAALERGFDGLRLTGNTLWVERDLWKSFVDYEEAVNSVIGNHRMIAVCTYCLTSCSGTDVLDVVRNHIGTLIKQDDKWYLIEDAARRKIANGVLKLSEQKYSALFENMQDGFAYHKVILDEKGKPADYVFLEINEAFERLTGLKRENVLGKAVTQVLPGIEKDPANWINIYGKVALTGEPIRFENYAEPLGRWYLVSAYSPAKGYFAASFEDITERKAAEREIVGLAKFPSENPHIVLRVDKDGAVLYSNPAGQFLLNEWKTKVGGRAPERIALLVSGVFSSERTREFEEIYEDQTFIFTLVPITHEGYVNIYGIDITERKKAEHAIRLLKERFEMAQRAAGVGVWDWNVKTGHIEWTREMFRLFGLDPQKDNASFETWNSVLHPEDREKAGANIDKALKNRSFLDNEYRIIRPDGQIVWINALGHGEYDDKNQPTRMSGICIDITERKKKEEILREQNLVISLAPDAVFSTDSSFGIKSWNAAAERMLGWTAEEVMGKASTSIFNIAYPTLDGTTRDQGLEQLLNTGSWSGEVIYQKKDGSNIPVSVSVSLVKDKDDNITGTVAVVHDITARKRREKELKETQRDLNRAQTVGKIGSWRLDTQHDILLWSDENHRIFGVPKGKPMTYESFLNLVHPDDRKYVDQQWKAGLRGKPYDIEHRIIVDGEVKWVREKAELEFDKDGTLLGGFGTTQEITDLVEMRKKLEEYSSQMELLANERAEKLRDSERLAAIGATAGMVGHDIRNPLQAIVGDLYLVKSDLASVPEGEEKEGMTESLADIEKNVEYINKIVQDLQDYARPLKPTAQETDFEEICIEVLFKNGVPEKIEASYQVEKEAKKLIADPLLLRRILSNLTNNAIQAMLPEGGKLEIHAYQDAGDFVITVHDTGAGITEEVKPHLFTPLFTTKSKGQGFGLAVVKRMTEALGGTVVFESEKGKGTKFTVRLPKK